MGVVATNQSRSGGKMSKTAIIGLVLSAFMCIPIFPLIGGLFGVVALIRISKDPNLSGKGIATAAVVMGSSGILIFPIMAAIAIPAFIKYIRAAKTAEVEDRLGQIARSAELYYGQQRVTAQGEPLPPQFPETTPVTPARSCAENADGRCPPDPSAWSHPTWQALNFSISDRHYFRYRFVSNGTAFTARALGDLDSDGVFSTFERSGLGAPDGSVTLTPGLYRENPTE